MAIDVSKITFYKSSLTPCSYLPDLSSSSLYANPYDSPSDSVYSHLIQFGFRRSGDLIYRPDCGACRRCIPVRLKACEFSPGRRFRRILRNNVDIVVSIRKPAHTSEYFSLYHRYLAVQHAGGSMDNPTEQEFSNFLVSHWLDSHFLEFRLDKQLAALAVVDRVTDGLSSVYTFYDPELKSRSLGHLAIMQQITLTREQALPYLYLGYWIRACAKMSYKSDYQPLQYFIDDQWLEKEEFDDKIKSPGDAFAPVHQYV